MTPPEGVVLYDSQCSEILQRFAQPLLRQAGLSHMKIHIIHDRRFNAFATVSGEVFVFTGCLTGCTNAQEWIAVLAHEIGHIVGQHSIKIYDEYVRAQRRGILLGILTACLGIAGGNPAGGAMLGSISGQHAMMDSVSHYRRDQEFFADQWAFRALQDLGWPVMGLKTLMEKFEQYRDEGFEYLRTHPQPAERGRMLKVGSGTLPESLRQDWKTLQWKVHAYLSAPAEQPADLPLWGQAIVQARQGHYDRAVKNLSRAVRLAPKNPFLWELYAQCLWYSRQKQRALEALETALRLRPHDRGLVTLLAHIVAEMNHKSWRSRVTQMLERLVLQDEDHDFLWHALGMLYAQDQKKGRMHVCMAYKHYHQDQKTAGYHALAQGLSLLKKNDPFRLKAWDLYREWIQPDVSRGTFPPLRF